MGNNEIISHTGFASTVSSLFYSLFWNAEFFSERAACSTTRILSLLLARAGCAQAVSDWEPVHHVLPMKLNCTQFCDLMHIL